MNPILATAAVLTVLLAAAHSYLGERYILTRLFRRGDLPKLLGGATFTQDTLRLAWHVTSVLALGFAALLVGLAAPGGRLLRHRRTRGLGVPMRSTAHATGALFAMSLGVWAAAATAAQAGPMCDAKSACNWSEHCRVPAVRARDKVVPPEKIHDVPVKWPQAGELGVSVRRRGKGMPVVEALIGENGRVADVRLIKRATWQPPWPEFDEAVLEAVRQWEFKPATLGGRPVQGCLTVAVLVHWR